MPGCLSCGRGFCEECHLPSDECCLQDMQTSPYLSSVSPVSSVGRKPGPRKLDADVKDPRSTMRRRAQALLRDVRGIEIGSPCEWQGLSNAGGGNHPIVGCIDGAVRHIHHGPDKNWYHNTPDNLHGICNGCHNRWHSRNDSCYNPDKPHEPETATYFELDQWNPMDEKKFKMPVLDHEKCVSVEYTAPVKPE